MRISVAISTPKRLEAPLLGYGYSNAAQKSLFYEITLFSHFSFPSDLISGGEGGIII